MFTKIDGDRFRQATRYIEDRIQRIGGQISASLPFDSGTKIENLLAMVLPPDDSAFQFSAPGVGVTRDLEETLKGLFDRFVEKYSTPFESARRDDEEVWKVYRKPLERLKMTSYLSPKRIVTPNYDYEFQHSWKNQVWHVCEPISLDLVEATSMVEKANRWLGRATILSDSKEKFRMYILLGEPQESSLRGAFTKAQNILHKMPTDHQFIREGEAERFANELAHEIKHIERERLS
jgi:hypothetical protein